MRLLLLFVPLLFASCSSTIMHNSMNMAQGEQYAFCYQTRLDPSDECLEITRDTLKDYREASTTRGFVTVSGPESHASTTRSLASVLHSTLSENTEVAGLTLPYHLDIVLVPQDGNVPDNIEVRVDAAEREWTIPLIIPAKARSASAVLQNCAPSAFIIGHELYEHALISLHGETRIISDSRAGVGPIGVKLHTNTRWFRDGYATWASWHWNQKLGDELGFKSHPALQAPIFALTEDRAKVLDWSQFGSSRTTSGFHLDRNHRLLSPYQSSFGAFLAIEAEFGSQTIRNVLQRLPERRHADGDTLRRLFSDEIGMPLKDWLNECEFPCPAVDLNLEFTTDDRIVIRDLDPLESDLRANDEIIRIGKENTSTVFDFQYALLQQRDYGSVDVRVLRDGRQHTVNIPLELNVLEADPRAIPTAIRAPSPSQRTPKTYGPRASIEGRFVMPFEEQTFPKSEIQYEPETERRRPLRRLLRAPASLLSGLGSSRPAPYIEIEPR